MMRAAFLFISAMLLSVVGLGISIGLTLKYASKSLFLDFISLGKLIMKFFKN